MSVYLYVHCIDGFTRPLHLREPDNGPCELRIATHSCFSKAVRSDSMLGLSAKLSRDRQASFKLIDHNLVCCHEKAPLISERNLSYEDQTWKDMVGISDSCLPF